MGSLSQLAESDAAYEALAGEDANRLGKKYNLPNQKIRPSASWLEGKASGKWVAYFFSLAVALAATFLIVRCYHESKRYQKEDAPNRRRLARAGDNDVCFNNFAPVSGGSLARIIVAEAFSCLRNDVHIVCLVENTLLSLAVGIWLWLASCQDCT